MAQANTSQSTEREELIRDVLKKARSRIRKDLANYSDGELGDIVIALTTNRIDFGRSFVQALAKSRAIAKDESRSLSA